MTVVAFKPEDTVYVICADCGGGDAENPHRTLKSALARVGNETGIEIWQTTFADYIANEKCGGPDYPDIPTAHCVYSNW